MDTKKPKPKTHQKTVEKQLEPSPADTSSPSVPTVPATGGDIPFDPDAEKLAKLREHARTVLAPYQFQPGHTGNKNGRPRDIVKDVGKMIANKRAGKALSDRERKLAEDLDMNPNEITMLEQIMLSLATSKNPLKIALFLERTYGKVANININAEVNTALVMRFRSKFTDAELEDIADGANPMDILFDKLPDVDDAPRLDTRHAIDVDSEDV
jgi:hypothetical protein